MDLSDLGGWIDDGGHEPIAATMPRMASDANHLILEAEPSRPVLLYRAWWDVGGAYPNYPAQTIGDCVSHGHSHANDLLQCLEIILEGDSCVPRATCSEFVYGESRKVGHMLGRMDGSYGSAAVKAMTTVGMVPRAAPGVGAYDGGRAKEWGRTGPPPELETLANQYKLGNATLIGTVPEAVSALASGHPFTICSNQGFSTRRDADGSCRAQGRWAHCMFVAAWRPSPRRQFLICQSWGNDSPTGPTTMDQPPFSFWVEEQVMGRILSQGDSFALFAAPEFLKRELPASYRKAP